MANGAQAFEPVMAALSTLQSNVDRTQKSKAHEFLEAFQKSVCCMAVPLRSFTDNTWTARCVDVNIRDAAGAERYLRSKALCCHDIEGQGNNVFGSGTLPVVTNL